MRIDGRINSGLIVTAALVRLDCSLAAHVIARRPILVNMLLNGEEVASVFIDEFEYTTTTTSNTGEWIFCHDNG